MVKGFVSLPKNKGFLQYKILQPILLLTSDFAMNQKTSVAITFNNIVSTVNT